MSAVLETAPPGLMTADELLRLPMGRGERYELVEGELITMSPAGPLHGRIAVRIGGRLDQHVYAKKLGEVYGAETGFTLQRNPDTVRAPDASFVSAARVKKAGKVKGFFPGAPDLAVEVVSPNDTAEDVQEKIDEYFAAGTLLVWVIYPQTQKVVVFKSARESVVLGVSDTLEGGEVAPGFACPVGELFE
jgi:Uma2 family endonuclease